ncbi:hypothetical protein HZS_4475 [Henneguya salminicola]|nr:hypothetical protein HZS_4475 [Henneguya salminicola]
MLSFATLNYDTDSILYAAGGTLILTVVLTLFACQTKYDFTGWGPYLLIFSIGLMIFGIFAAIFADKSKTLYLIFDVQLLIGGKSGYRHSIRLSSFFVWKSTMIF